MTEDIKEKNIEWFNDIAELCGKLTSGNVSHLAATIKGKAIRSAEFIEKHCYDSPWISVEDELPKVKKQYSEYVLVRYISGGYNISCYRKETEEWFDGKTLRRIPIAITHWMPIPKLNKK